MPQDAYTIAEVSQRLGIAVQTVRKLVKAGDIPSIHISERRIIIPVSAFEQWLIDRATRV